MRVVFVVVVVIVCFTVVCALAGCSSFVVQCSCPVFLLSRVDAAHSDLQGVFVLVVARVRVIRARKTFSLANLVCPATQRTEMRPLISFAHKSAQSLMRNHFG